MNDKLTPRQNELISEALCNVGVGKSGMEGLPVVLTELRRSLVNELQAVAAETSPI